MKMALGNALFLAIMVAWCVYVKAEVDWMLSGAIMGFACFVSGIVMGYLLRGPGKTRRIFMQSPAEEYGHADVVPSAEVVHHEHPAETAAAPQQADEALHAESSLPDIPGPDDLEDAAEPSEAPDKADHHVAEQT